MNIKKLLFLALLILCVDRAHAQSDFCDAADAIIKDAPNKFRNIRGNAQNVSAGGNMWSCGIKVPGTINSRFVASMGLFYEGAFFQTKNKSEVKAAYDKYSALMSDCFTAKGYTIHPQDNFTPELKNYQKLVFMAAEQETATAPPAHVTMETMYNKQLGIYTIVMYIFEH